MNLARFSVNRPVAAGIISVAIFLLGLFSVRKMPVALYPEVSFPFVSVIVPLPGASTEQIEKKIVKPLEKEMASIKGNKRVIARIRPGVANVVVGFKMNVDPREATDTVRERVAKLRSTFPKDAKEPIVSRVDLGATPVLIYGVESAKSPEETKKLLDDGLVRELQRTDGVNEAEVVGLGEEQVEIDLDPAKLAANRVAPLDVYQQLSTYLATIPWGDVRQDGQVLSVSRAALSQEPDFWTKHEITLADGRTVRLSEIGQARKVNDAEAALVRINGKPGLGLVVTKRSEANTLDTVKKVQSVVGKVDPASGLKLFPIIDQSQYIEANAHEVWIALFAGGAFAVLVILFFLTDVRSAIITATALPVSVAGTFIFMSWLGFSINMMSLLALALAIGLLIDDAVVVREAIFSEIEHGKSAKEAAVSGTDKVAAAVLATTLAVVAVFLPVSAMEGMVGQFFKEFGLTIVVAVLLSLWVAFTLDPMLSARFGGAHKPLAGKFWDGWRSFLTSLEHKAGALAAWAYKRPLPVILASMLLLVGSVGLVLSRGADFLAFEDRGQLVVNVAAPAGSPKERSAKLADEAYQRMKDLDGLTDVYAKVAGEDATRTEMRLVFVDKTKREKGLLKIAAELREKMKDMPAEVLVLEPPPVEGVGAEAPLAVYVYGDEFSPMFAEAERVADAIRKIPGVANLRIETGRQAPGFDVALNESELGYYGTNAGAVEMTGRLALTGLEAGTVGSDNLSLYVRYPEDQRSFPRLWEETYVPTPKGPVLLSSLATAKESSTPTKIDREKRSRKIVLFGTLDRTRSYGNVLKDIEQVLGTIKAPQRGEVAGDKELFEEMASNFTIAIVGSAFFIFIILAIQFENLVRPFVILLTLPLAVIGAFLALFLAGEKLALGALIGIILLIGLAAKNGILLVDAIGIKEKTQALADAVKASVTERFRPILMTSVAMIFGMIPTAVMRGGGSEFRAPMAIAIIGGVISSTLLSVMIVPAIFGFIGKVRERKTRFSSKRLRAAAALVALAMILVPQVSKAEEAKADMTRVVSLLKSDPREGSREALSIRAAEEASSGLTTSSRAAFLGGLKADAERQWTKPGVTQETTLPLPPQIGGPVTVESVVVPKVQNVYQIGWSVPIFSMQAIKGLEVAARTRDQEAAVKHLQKESASRAKAQLLLQYELAQKVRRVQEERVQVASSRLNTVKAKVAAGLARRAQLDEAEASLATAEAEREKAKTDIDRLRIAYRAQAGDDLPAEGLGLPQFPYAGDKPFNPAALKALDNVARIYEANAEVVDAGFVPTVEVSAARQIKDYEGAPVPQNVFGLKASWTILDAGSRRRNVAEQKRAQFQAQADAAGTALELRTAYDSLKTRRAGAEHGLTARRAALKAAEQAVNDALASFNSGTGRLLDVRSADEMRLGAELGVYQAELELQAIAIESLVLTDQWLAYLESGKA